jgi:hypothetical protein
MKNLLGILPTYDILKDRDKDLYKNGQCIRCKRAFENWHHIWVCEANKTSIRQIIEQETSKVEHNVKELNLFNINFIWKETIIKILGKESENFTFCRKIHDVIKGLVLKDLYLKKENKEYKMLIKNMVEAIMIKAKKEIWNVRCKEVIETEKKLDIQVGEKRRKIESSTNYAEVDKSRGRVNANRRFVEEVMDRWTERLIENNETDKKIWQQTRIEDLWGFDKNIKYIESNYVNRIGLFR